MCFGDASSPPPSPRAAALRSVRTQARRARVARQHLHRSRGDEGWRAFARHEATCDAREQSGAERMTGRSGREGLRGDTGPATPTERAISAREVAAQPSREARQSAAHSPHSPRALAALILLGETSRIWGGDGCMQLQKRKKRRAIASGIEVRLRSLTSSPSRRQRPQCPAEPSAPSQPSCRERHRRQTSCHHPFRRSGSTIHRAACGARS
jgi:hypothetical protein